MPNFAGANSIFTRPDSILNNAYRCQILATLTLNIITFSHGVGVGWLSPTLITLQSEESPLDFSVTIAEASWIGSLMGLGSILGNLLSGITLNQFGRKVCIYMVAIPHMCLWVLIYFAKSVEFLYVARFMGGVSGGFGYVVVPLFVSEIADPKVRGRLSSILMLSVNMGILFGFIMSTHLNYYVMPFIVIILPIIYLISITFFPETPQYLLKVAKVPAAEDSFKFYKNYSEDKCYNELIKCKQEFDDLRKSFGDEQGVHSVCFKDFFTKPALKASLTAFFMLLANQGSGSFAFVSYMSHIFAESGSLLEPNTCTIIVGVVQIFGVYIATLFVDNYGRKILMLISSGGVVVGLTLFGLFTYFAKYYDLTAFLWVPLVLMICVVFLLNIGIVPLTFVVTIEVFPAKIRSIAASGCMIVLSSFVFIVLKVFPICLDVYGISITLWLCALNTFICFLYFLIFLKETKTKQIEDNSHNNSPMQQNCDVNI